MVGVKFWQRPAISFPEWALKVIAVAVVYFLGGQLGLLFATYHGTQVTLIWPPSGLSLALLLLWGWSVWPGIALGSLLLAFHISFPWQIAASVTLGNTLQAVCGAYLLQRVGFRKSLERQRDILHLVLWGAGVSPIVSATIDVTSFCLMGLAPWHLFAPMYVSWWLGDAAGILLFSPLLLSWGGAPRRLGKSRGRLREGLILALCLLLTSYLAFAAEQTLAPQKYPLAFLPFPFLIWAALRFGIRGGSFGATLISLFAIVRTAGGDGPFVATDVGGSVLLLWSFISSVASLSLLLGVVWGERRRAELALKSSEERFRSAFEDAPIGIALIGLDGQLQEVNRRFNEMMAFDRDDLLSRTFFDLAHPDDLKGSMKKFLEVLDSGGKVPPFEERFIRRDGEIIWVSVSSTPFGDTESGLPAGLIAQVEDITLRKHSEEERRVLQQQLLQAQKMESLGQMVGGVAHDFNNLMLAVLGYADLALNDESLDPVLRDYLSQIRQAGNRASELTRKLLTFSRNQVLKSEVLDLNRLVGGLMKILHRLIPESVAIEWYPDPAIDRVEADPGQIEQVIINLCVNARDSMPEGGHLMISTSNVRLSDAELQHQPHADRNAYVRLTVSDEGCGIPVEHLERVFDPFFTTKDPTEGTGLGLAMVYGIVRKHRGFIEVDSEEESGTTFRIFLPATEHAVATEALLSQYTVKAQPVDGGYETLLVVEDEETVRTLATRILEGAGYDVCTAEDGEQALEVFERRHETIDLVILDVVMPRLGGRETYERVRALEPMVPVMFTSGYAGSELPSDFLRREGLTLLPKPYDAATLLREVRRLLDESPALGIGGAQAGTADLRGEKDG